MSPDQHAEYGRPCPHGVETTTHQCLRCAEAVRPVPDCVAGDCRLWDFVGLNSWRCLCGRAYERGTNKRQTHLDDLSGPMTHADNG